MSKKNPGKDQKASFFGRKSSVVLSFLEKKKQLAPQNAFRSDRLMKLRYCMYLPGALVIFCFSFCGSTSASTRLYRHAGSSWPSGIQLNFTPSDQFSSFGALWADSSPLRMKIDLREWKLLNSFRPTWSFMTVQPCLSRRGTTSGKKNHQCTGQLHAYLSFLHLSDLHAFFGASCFPFS